MRAVLGIDAAWTEQGPSGVALIQEESDNWRVVCVAPSYEAFIAASRETPVDWHAGSFTGSWPKIGELIKAAREMTTAPLCVVAVDMPLSKTSITSRRAADSAISRAFGSRGCSTHSPNRVRPGSLGESLTAQLLSAGFPLATAPLLAANSPCAIEVYPHQALLMLLGRDYRVPYKVSRSWKYWPGASVSERISRLLEEFDHINSALGTSLGGEPLRLPSGPQVPALAALKRYEDALDALVCAWVGLRFAKGTAVSYGDESAAIWVPSPSAA